MREAALAAILTLIAAVLVACGGTDGRPLYDQVSRQTFTTPTSVQSDSISQPRPSPTRSVPPTLPTAQTGAQPGGQGPRVAFFGDQGLGRDAIAVLELVKAEGADMVIHLGDFDYEDDPAAWERQINQVLGPDYPYFAVIGNHDTARWSTYQPLLTSRLGRVQGAICEGDYGVNAACTYQGLFFLLSGAGTRGSGHARFAQEQLAANNATWSICAWHKNQEAMQVGGKDDDAGWEIYEVCREGGAIIATGHEHSYSRTKTLSSMRNQTVDTAWPEPASLRVGSGSSFVFVSGLGGKSIRDQERCRPVTAPYGCGQIWASIYTANQGATHGALFIDFGVDGEPAKARGYFKNISGEVIDEFIVTAQ